MHLRALSSCTLVEVHRCDAQQIDFSSRFESFGKVFWNHTGVFGLGCIVVSLRMVGWERPKAAAQNWQKKVQETMATLGFSIGKASPVLFCHPQRSLISGEPVDLVWMRNELESKLGIESSVGTMESGYPVRQIGNTQKQSSANQEHPI